MGGVHDIVSLAFLAVLHSKRPFFSTVTLVALGVIMLDTIINDGTGRISNKTSVDSSDETVHMGQLDDTRGSLELALRNNRKTIGTTVEGGRDLLVVSVYGSKEAHLLNNLFKQQTREVHNTIPDDPGLLAVTT